MTATLRRNNHLHAAMANNMMYEEEQENGWYGNLELRTPPPMSSNASDSSHTLNGSTNGMNGHTTTNGTNSRKRSWGEVATPTAEVQAPLWDDIESLETLGVNLEPSMGFVTPEFSQNGDGSISIEPADEEIPRTKMQTGCIPCLYVD